jgi:hypothetical protein
MVGWVRSGELLLAPFFKTLGSYFLSVDLGPYRALLCVLKMAPQKNHGFDMNMLLTPLYYE